VSCHEDSAHVLQAALGSTNATTAAGEWVMFDEQGWADMLEDDEAA
jgi:hypothetical protein